MKTKRILSLVLAAVLCLASALTFASCGSSAYNIPIVCGETGMSSECGVATYGVDYYNLGVKAGDMAADILLEGQDPATMAVQTDPTPALSINEAVAAEIGFTIPDSIKNRVTGTTETTEVTRVTTAIVEDNADYTVGILQQMLHVALDQSNKGFQDQLSVRMNAAGKTVKILDQNASGEAANNTTIANDFVSKNVDLIYTIATTASQAAVTAVKDTEIPVIFNAVTNPVDAGLVESMEVPGGNVTGVSDINPVDKQILLIGELLGKEEIKIGLLYTAGETNSVFQIGLAKTQCEKSGYTYVDKGISDANDLQAAFVALKAAGVDAIYIPTDNVLANGVANIHIINTGK